MLKTPEGWFFIAICILIVLVESWIGLFVVLFSIFAVLYAASNGWI